MGGAQAEPGAHPVKLFTDAFSGQALGPTLFFTCNPGRRRRMICESAAGLQARPHESVSLKTQVFVSSKSTDRIHEQASERTVNKTSRWKELRLSGGEPL